MKCPACFNALKPLEVGGVVVDACYGGCGGIWFDAFELQRFDEKRETAGEQLLHIPRDEQLVIDFTRKRDCPRCEGIKLHRHFFSAKRRVQVDQCPNCGGYWLDAGELEQIRAENAAAAMGQQVVGTKVSMEVVRYLYRLSVTYRKAG